MSAPRTGRPFTLPVPGQPRSDSIIHTVAAARVASKRGTVKKQKAVGAMLALAACVAVPTMIASPVMAAWPQSQQPATVVAETPTGPAFTVEDYVHPEASRLGAVHGIKLMDGNGNMLLKECGSAEGLIQVESVEATNNLVCFQVTKAPAWLNMEITGSFGIKAGVQPLEVTSTLDGQQQKMTVPASARRPVGAGDGESVIVQLKVS